MHGAEKVRDTTLDDENTSQRVTCVVVMAHVMSVVMMALANQPVLFSDCTL